MRVPGHPFNPRHEDGWCHYCGKKIPGKPWIGSDGQGGTREYKPSVGVTLIRTTLFCTGACGVAYAELCLEQGHRYVKRSDTKEEG